MNYLNLGCGYRWQENWYNLDLYKSSPSVIACNFLEGIPFPDNFFEVIYTSHVLEHIPRDKVKFVLDECKRVLRSEGVIRIVVPDLEEIVNTYLFTLKQIQSSSQSQKWEQNYEWITLELFDQMTRDRPGGEMLQFLKRESLDDESFILERGGSEIAALLTAIRQQKKNASNQTKSRIASIKKNIKLTIAFLTNIKKFREFLLRLLLGKEYEALAIGRFRLSGEVHQWMYDFYSLSRLLEDCGFKQIARKTAYDSQIPNWGLTNLDLEPNGTIYKPNSLIVEATKARTVES